MFRIIGLKEIDLAKARKETSLNNLETAIIDIREKLGQSDYASVATDEESKSILDKCAEVICLLFYAITFQNSLLLNHLFSYNFSLSVFSDTYFVKTFLNNKNNIHFLSFFF